MRNETRFARYHPESAIMLVACVVCALAWWWWRSGATISDRVDPPLSYLSEVFWIPGWFIVTGFDSHATTTTDILVPLVSGIFWGLLGLLALKSFRLVRKYIHRDGSS
jgi:hypothetical protein